MLRPFQQAPQAIWRKPQPLFAAAFSTSAAGNLATFKESRSRCLLRPFQQAPQAIWRYWHGLRPSALIIVSSNRVSKPASLPAAHAEGAEAKTGFGFLEKQQ
ncbi:MAG: hypothetical protein H7838_13950, partial [Magnetococcus sp. DMHC-8]